MLRRPNHSKIEVLAPKEEEEELHYYITLFYEWKNVIEKLALFLCHWHF